jgi:mannan endo-1,4-beta-mannosidase
MLSALFVFAFSAARQIYEAESATRGAQDTVEASIAGYSGTGYVYFKQGPLTWTIHAAQVGLFNLGFRHANPLGGERKEVISVNGKEYGYTPFPDGPGWVEFEAVAKVKLIAGENRISLIRNFGWHCIDYLYLDPYVETPWSVAAAPVAGTAAGAVALYGFLKQNFQSKIISGAMTLQGGEEYSMVEPNWIYENTGRYPAILGLDFMHQTGKESAWYYNDPVFSKQVARDATNYWNRGGIPALCWHWRDPSHATNDFYSSQCKFSPAKAVTAGTAENQAVMRDLKAVADQLQALRDAGVAVLWRPLHEGTGDWFWWHNDGAEAYKKLWKLEFDYFVKERKLNNLLWVFTGGTPSDPAPQFYPGDDMVDIIGMDIYVQGDHSSQTEEFGKMKKLFGAKKIIAMSECGSIPDPQLSHEDAAMWSYFMPWYKEYVIPQGTKPYNSLDFWKKTMTSKLVVTLSDMPGWKK